MGWCHEFGCQIAAGCSHPMQAGATACTCADCGVVCKGRFESCAEVWARGPVALVEGPTRPSPPRRRESQRAAQRQSQASPPAAPPAPAVPAVAEAATPRPDAMDALAWLRREFAGLHVQLRGLSERVGQQEAGAMELAAAQASELNVTLAELEGCAGELRNESDRLRELRHAMTEAVPPMVDAAARHAVSASADDLRSEFRSELAALANSLPGMVTSSLQQAVDDLRATLPGIVDASVRQAMGDLAPPASGEVPAGTVPAELSDALVDELHRAVRESVASTVTEALSATATAAPSVTAPAEATAPTPPPPVEDRADQAPAEEQATPEHVARAADQLPFSPQPAPPAEPAQAPDERPAVAVDEVSIPAVDSPAVCTLAGLAVGPSVATDVSRALARARIRRRRLRQAGPPAAGLYRQDPYVGRIATGLERFALARGDLAFRRRSAETPGGDSEPGDGLPATVVAAGEKNGQEVALNLAQPGGVSVIGPDSSDVCRALIATLIAGAEPPAAEIAVIGDLLGDRPELPGVARVRELGPVLDRLEPEVARRSSLVQASGAASVATYLARNPHELMPGLIVATSEVGEHAERLRALLERAPGLGVAVLLVDVELPGATTVRLRSEGAVEAVTPDGRIDDLLGARLFRAGAASAAEVLNVLASARTDQQLMFNGDVPEESFRTEKPSGEAPIQVSLLGAQRIEVGGDEIRSGLRAKARELLAFYLLHPEGTTLDAATEALWPEADPGRGSEWFWTALGNLRSLLRGATGQRELKVIERFGDQYRIEPVFDVDLWRFEEALTRAASNGGADASWAAALQEAADMYRGDLLSGADWAWVEVPRDDLRRRAVDTLVSLAASRQVGGDVTGALAALQRAIEVDPLAEQLYRRIMRLYARLSRPDDVAATFQHLKGRLVEFGLEPTAESAQLCVELTGAN